MLYWKSKDAYDFHLKGGTIFRLHGVKSVTLTRDSDGNYVRYEIVWHKGYARFVSFSLSQIAAVIQVGGK